MAEASVKSFLQRLSSLKLQENEASPDLQDQIQKLKNRVEEIGNFPGEVDTSSKQYEGLVCNCESNLIETVHDANNCIDQYVAKTTSRDGSDQALSILQFRSELENIDARLAGISRPMSQSNMPSRPTSEAKEEIGESSSTHRVDVIGEESLDPFASNYRNLPSYLRSSLLYCSLFPKGIRRGRLVRLLVAEGIFQERAGEVMEDIVEENINQLVEQGMLRIKISYEHELKVVHHYRKICQLKLQQGEPINWFLSSDSNFTESSSIVLVQYHGETIRTSLNDDPIRSLFVYCTRYSQGLVPYEYWVEGIPDDHWASIRSAFHTFNFLRVLEFHNLKVKSLPEEIGHLINLRYLGLKSSALDEIPESIGNLLNLQTLDIRWPGWPRVLPSGVLNLAQLRHLMLPRNGIKVPSGIGILTNLQSLTNLFIRPGIIQELRSLTQLKKLKLRDVSEEHGSELSACIMRMTGLLCLSTDSGYGEDEMLPTLDPFSPPPFMRHLSLCGHLVDLPDWVCSMESLTKLNLGNSFLPEEAIYVLQFLPNLKHLNLGGACNSKQINKEFCKVGGFPKLETLRICSRDLVEWTEIEKGAFPSLAFLFFQNCLRMMNLPEGLQYVTTLKELMIVALHPDLERRLKPDGGKENYKIKHIPLIRSSRAKLQKLLL